MLNSRRALSAPSTFGCDGMTRTEILVLTVVLVLLLVVAAGLAGRYLEKLRIDHAVESAHALGTVLYLYSNDNNGVYPVGDDTTAVGKSEGIARNLLANNYTPDPGIFALGSTEKYSGKASDFSDFTAANISWDFTAGATASTGITSSAPDLLPVIYTTGETIPYPVASGAGLNLTLSGNGPFGKKGVVVAYKNNTAKFIQGMASGTNVVGPGFISTAFKDTGTYTQIKP